MRWLLFLARVAVICNAFFLICLLLLFTKLSFPAEMLNALIITMGWFLAFPINFIVNITEFTLVLSRKPSPTPVWMRIFNFAAFILQVLIQFFIPHDALHT